MADAWWETGSGRVQAPAELCLDAGGRFQGEHFQAAPGLAGGLRLALVPWLPPDARVLEGFTGPLGRWQREGPCFRVALSERTPEAAVAALRLCWNAGIQEAGAVLVHASAVAWNGLAAIALGPSGAGKSTLARLCVEAGGTLLSDEIVALHPDGRCVGTPFRSDLELPGTPGPFRAAALLLLEKGPDEALLPVSGPTLVQACLGQLFSPEGSPADRGECFSRLVTFLSRVEARTLRFRKHADAGAYVRDFISALSQR